MKRHLAPLVCCLGVLACDETPVPGDPVGPDGVAPEVQFTGSSADADGDGLVDLHLVWHDDAGVDAASLAVELIAANGTVVPGTPDLIGQWEVVRAGTAGIHLEETVATRLPAGSWRFRATVLDSTGTPGTAMGGPYVLRRLSLMRSISLRTFFAGSLSYCPARGEVYVHNSIISVVDVETFEVREKYLGGTRLHPRSIDDMACVDDSPDVLTAPSFDFFDVESLAWADTGVVPGLVAAEGIEPAASNRVLALAFFVTDSAYESRAIEFDPETRQVVASRSLASLGTEITEIVAHGADLFAATVWEGPRVIRDWRPSEMAATAVDGAVGEFVDMDVHGGSIYTLAASNLGANLVVTDAATGQSTADRWFENHPTDLAISPDGRMFVPIAEVCSPLQTECDLDHALLLLPDGQAEQVAVPTPARRRFGEQAAFSDDGALLFWVVSPGYPDLARLLILLHRH